MILQRVTINNFNGTLTQFEVSREEFTCREGLGGWPVRPRAFICPFCLRKWAQIDHPPALSRFHLESVSCLSCKQPEWRNPFTTDWWWVNPPGSILTYSIGPDIDWGLLDCLPPELLKREFDLTLKAFT